MQEHTSLVDGIISVYLPHTPELHDLVKTYQIRHHLKTCRKNKNEKYRLHFGHYFTDRTIIARPVEVTLSSAKKKKYYVKEIVY